MLGQILPFVFLKLSHLNDIQPYIGGERIQRKCYSSFSYLKVQTYKNNVTLKFCKLQCSHSEMRPGCLKYLIGKTENVFFILFSTSTMKNKFPGLNRTYFNKRKRSNFLKHKKKS